jgi:hypothetical protein
LLVASAAYNFVHQKRKNLIGGRCCTTEILEDRTHRHLGSLHKRKSNSRGSTCCMKECRRSYSRLSQVTSDVRGWEIKNTSAARGGNASYQIHHFVYYHCLRKICACSKFIKIEIVSKCKNKKRERIDVLCFGPRKNLFSDLAYSCISWIGHHITVLFFLYISLFWWIFGNLIMIIIIRKIIITLKKIIMSFTTQIYFTDISCLLQIQKVTKY